MTETREMLDSAERRIRQLGRIRRAAQAVAREHGPDDWDAIAEDPAWLQLATSLVLLELICEPTEREYSGSEVDLT